MNDKALKVKCLINHADVVFIGMILDVKELVGNQVRVEGLDGFPVWLSLNYNAIKEFEFIEY